jgi:hypothetical protein
MRLKHAFTFAFLAAAYDVTPQRASQLVAEHGWDVATNPQALFRELLTRRACPLRSKLSDPLFRAKAERSLSAAAFRCAVKPRAIRKPKSLPTTN